MLGQWLNWNNYSIFSVYIKQIDGGEGKVMYHYNQHS